MPTPTQDSAHLPRHWMATSSAPRNSGLEAAMVLGSCTDGPIFHHRYRMQDGGEGRTGRSSGRTV
eukprot:7454820-Pyramimonas_sp.AAC.1